MPSPICNRLSCLLAFFLFSFVGKSQESQLLYLKTLPNSALVPMSRDSAFVIQVTAYEPFDASIWPESDPYIIDPQLTRTVVMYDYDFNPIGYFEVNTALSYLSPLLRTDSTFIFQQKYLNGEIDQFNSSPELTGDYPPFIYGQNYILTYNIGSDELKMPFNCQCPPPGSSSTPEHSFPVTHYKNTANVLSQGGSAGAATSNGRIVTTLGQFDDILINWEDDFPIGENYWNTLWLKIDPLSGDYISTPLLSDQGTALTSSIFTSETGNAIFRSGILRGNGIPMSPDGTEWFTNQSDSMYYAFFLKENENGEQDWMKTLYAYNNTDPDFDPSGSGLYLQHRTYSEIELNENIFLSESYKFNLRPGDTLIFKDFFGNEGAYSAPSNFDPGANSFIAKSAHSIFKFSSNGVPLRSLTLPLLNPNNTYDNYWLQNPFLTKSGDKLGWVNQYKSNQDTTIYFIRNALNTNIDSVGVNLPAGNGVFITWMDSYFNIITTANIPFSPGSSTLNSGVTLYSASIYHGDTLLLAGNIDAGTTTSLDPSGMADNILYENSIRFIAFYTLPAIINDTPEIENNRNFQAFSIFPNPSVKTFTIRGNQDDVLESWTVFDLSGQLVGQGKELHYKNENCIRLNAAPGVYLLSLKTTTGRMESHRIVVGD